MFHGERTEHVPRGTEPIDTQPTPEAELEIARETIALGLAALKLDPEPAVIDQFIGLAELLSNWAPRMNLTGHRGAEEIARRLILDALALIEVLPEFESLADLGSGAGFPGLPIAVLFPDRKVVSVESRSRRVSFQRTAIRQLGLQNVTILHGRIESLDPQQCNGVVAQAVAPPERVLDWMLPWCLDGGWVAIPGTAESLASPPPAAPTHNDAQVRSYCVPPRGGDRWVWVARKCAVPVP